MDQPTTPMQPVPAKTGAPSAPEQYETCEVCDAPVEASQRYCVVCGTRRKHVYDPAARFVSTATNARRPSARPAGKRRGPGLGTAVALALIPLAVVLGLLLGHSGNGEDAKLLAALRAQKPEVINVGGGAAASSTPVSASSLTSDFSLQRGYAVELQTLPSASTQSAVTAAESAARAKGASAVGLINQSAFSVTPRPPSGDYVIYSGQYKRRAEAQKALEKLKKAFPAAVVIAVVAKQANGEGGAILSTTSYGSYHSVVGLKPPSSSQLAAGAQIAKKVAGEINSNYVGSQKGLPNVISVP